IPRLKKSGKRYIYDYKRKQSIGRVNAFYGNFGVLVRALAYIQAHGGPGLRNATIDAAMTAVYIRKKLEPFFDLPSSSPNMHQAAPGDADTYIAKAKHALIDPLHPNNGKYVFLGDAVDLRGHSHPPGNAWPLAALLVLFGDVKEAPFHAAYIVFSLIAVWAMWTLACRFSERPVWTTLLFIAVPAFVVNGNSLEADLPFLAFWLAAIALFRNAGLLACL